MPKNQAEVDQILRHIDNQRLPYAKDAFDKFGCPYGVGLDIGAGSCWFSAYCLKLDSVYEMIAIDNKQEHYDFAKKYCFNHFNADIHKLKYLIEDFDKLSLPQNSIDFVVSEASLHHSQDLPKLVANVRKIIKSGSLWYAVREPILPTIEPFHSFQKHWFGWIDKLQGETEFIYKIDYWRDVFVQNGFEFNIQHFYPNHGFKNRLMKNFKFLNGKVFWRSYFVLKAV